MAIGIIARKQTPHWRRGSVFTANTRVVRYSAVFGLTLRLPNEGKRP
jgi:hypothetical protein